MAIVVRSLWAALGEVCVAGLVVGWVVDRLAVCWPMSWEVVVAVDIGTWNLLGESVEGPATKTADRPVAARAELGHERVAAIDSWRSCRPVKNWERLSRPCSMI